MAMMISMLRGVNVGGHHQISMQRLRELYESLGLGRPQTYIQSGNVVFETDTSDLTGLANRIEQAIEKNFGFHSGVILRTAPELKAVIDRNPFAARTDVPPNKLLVTFFGSDPGQDARETIRGVKADREELRLEDRELYIYFPDGMGRSKLSISALEKKLKIPCTTRNWNTVTKLVQLANGL